METENLNKEKTANQEPKGKLFERLELDRDSISKYLPMAVLAFALALVYIYISSLNIRLLNEAENLKHENKELRSELISIQTDLMTKSKQSEIAERVSKYGLKELRTPPYQLKKNSKK